MLFKKKDIERAKEMGLLSKAPEEKVTIKEVEKPKRDILNTAWKAITEHAFPITGPNDGKPLSVVRVDDIYDVLNRQLGENEQKLDIY